MTEAQALARKINFDITQQDNTLLLSRGFAISKQEKFRNQQLLVVIEVPLGKKIELSRSLDQYHWFTININRRHGWNISDEDDWDENWGDNYSWRSDVEYVMTKDGLERTDKKKYDSDEDENDDKKISPKTDNGYRYKSNADSTKNKTLKQPAKNKGASAPKEEKATTSTKESSDEDDNGKSASPAYFLSMIFNNYL
jgi:hypothetical protein